MIEIYDDAVLVPPPAKWRNPQFLQLGVLDNKGEPIQLANCAITRKSNRGYIPSSEQSQPNDKLFGRWLFGGICSHHFGHMLTRSVGRLAGLEFSGKIDGILFAQLDGRSSTGRNILQFEKTLRGLVGDYPVVVAQNATLVEHLLVGGDQFGEQTMCVAEPNYVEWLRETCLPKDIRPVPGSKLYVTRVEMGPDVGRILCEDILQSNLKKLNFEVYAPEVHSLSDQLAKYMSSETIVTTDGSHCHVMAFARQSNQRIIQIARRKGGMDLINNHMNSFGHGLQQSEIHVVDNILEEWWLKERASNKSFGEIDFHALFDSLEELGVVSNKSKKSWKIPNLIDITESKIDGLAPNSAVISNAEREQWIDSIRMARRERNMNISTSTNLDPIPKLDGLRYYRMLSQMHAVLKPKWYLEVGTFNGKSLSLASCNTVAVDPEFKINAQVINKSGSQMHFMQMTSDDFFASEFTETNGISYDFAFLDGLHLYEFLLRDFINTERRMSPNGIITLHDCCPSTVEMAGRENNGGAWTGDVWKTLLILLELRPDLNIQVSNAATTGLVVISNLDSTNLILENSYEEIVEKYKDLTLAGLPGGLGGLYRNFDLLSPKDIIETLATR